MAGKLPDELYQETQIGQILLQGKVINGDDAPKKVEAVADAQKNQPAAQRKLIGQMFVEAGLCSSQDVDAALEVQKNVRTELSKMLERGETADAKKVTDTINDAYTAYEKNHPDYHRPSPDAHAQMEVPIEITDGQGRRARIDHVRSVDSAEKALSSSAKSDGKLSHVESLEPHLK